MATTEDKPNEPSKVLTFLHLSDIHFRSRDGDTQYDSEAQLRAALIEDLKSQSREHTLDGLLVTGDIAFAGKKEDYERAKAWFDEVHTVAGIPAVNTYVSPGNHDVDRDMVGPKGAIWNNHVALRSEPNKVLRRDLLKAQLRDLACDPLAPLAAYNEFAQGYDCRSEREGLVWVHTFPKPLNDGSVLRLHGLNTALCSDEDDDVGKIYLSPFQTNHFRHEPGVTEMVLCHHPPSWLKDGMEVSGAFNSYVQVTLFGHEHTHRSHVLDQTVQLFAGAVHPAARDPDWLPTYHILKLWVEGTGQIRRLVVRVYTREFRALEHTFVTRSSKTGAYLDHKVSLLEWIPPTPIPVAQEAVPVLSSNENMQETSHSNLARDAFLRELLVHFHRLSTPVRLKIVTDLNLIRSGDDFPSRQLWDRVFERAKNENRLVEFWQQVAHFDAALAGRKNPFK